jgi:CubicO group peptidase (beta-lactamase class C family)
MLRLIILFIGIFFYNSLSAQLVQQPLANLSVESAGYKAGFFDGFTKELEDSSGAVGSFIVWQKSGIVYEHYFHSATDSQVFNIKSITKSVVSALAGIAHDKKLLPDLNRPVLTYFPEYAKDRHTVPGVLFPGWLASNDAMRKKLTLSNLLSMQPGFDWNDFGQLVNAYINSSDPVRFTLDLNFSDTPGTKFIYCSAAVSVFSAALAKAVKTDLRVFAKTNLFDPTGITLHRWDKDATGRYFGASEMYMTARDLLRFGLLYLHNGKVGNKQILSSEWVNESTAPHATLNYWDIMPNANGYGYYWWRRKTNGHQAFIASGAGGQLIAVIPDLEMVIVATTFFNERNRGREEIRCLHSFIDKVTGVSQAGSH